MCVYVRTFVRVYTFVRTCVCLCVQTEEGPLWHWPSPKCAQPTSHPLGCVAAQDYPTLHFYPSGPGIVGVLSGAFLRATEVRTFVYHRDIPLFRMERGP